ncbi:MAG TPA: restriction endonuclease subunit S [Opitutaceae bacterium]|nr:restriction endonuclease subunit S [Opitutaceae bacterium]
MTVFTEKSEEILKLPSGWRTARVGEILKIRNGYAFKSTDYKDTGVPLIRQSELKSDVIDLAEVKRVDPAFLQKLSGFVVREGDLLIGMSGSLGKIAEYQNQEPALQNQRTGLLILKPGYDAKFVRLVLKLVEPQIVAEGKGVAVQNVSANEIEACTFPLPPPDERGRIVAEIEQQFTRLDAGVAALRRTQANLKRYRAAVLKAACEGHLVPTEAELTKQQPSKRSSIPRKNSGPNFESGALLLERILAERRQNWSGRGKYEEPAVPYTAEFPKLPNGWSWACLEQLGMTYGGLTKNPKRAKLPKQLPYLRVANVYANELRLDEIEYIGVSDSELTKLLVRKGDLLIVEGNGSKDQIGRLAIWDGSIESCVHQNHLIKVRPVEAQMSKWILHWLQSPGGRQNVELVASSTSGLFTLSVSKVGNLAIPVPPLAEQTRIVAEVERRLSVVGQLEKVLTANLHRAKHLRQSILQMAFTGSA